MDNKQPVRVLVVGCGHMGKSHAKAYQKLDGFEIVGVVSRSSVSREVMFAELGETWPGFDSYEQALEELKPDAVSINGSGRFQDPQAFRVGTSPRRSWW